METFEDEDEKSRKILSFRFFPLWKFNFSLIFISICFRERSQILENLENSFNYSTRAIVEKRTQTFESIIVNEPSAQMLSRARLFFSPPYTPLVNFFFLFSPRERMNYWDFPNTKSHLRKVKELSFRLNLLRVFPVNRNKRGFELFLKEKKFPLRLSLFWNVKVRWKLK